MDSEAYVVRDVNSNDAEEGGMFVPWHTPIHLCPSTLPCDSEGVKRRINFMGQSTLELGRDGSLEMVINHVLAYPRETTDNQTGEVSRHSWIVLIDPQGQTWGTSSPIVAEKVFRILAGRSAGLVDWPCPVMIVTRTARRSGHRYHDLVML